MWSRLNSRYILNKLYYLYTYTFHQIHEEIDISSKISGEKYLHVGEIFIAVKHLWLETVTEYNGQHFHSTLIIKDNVSLSDFNHVGVVNYVEIGSNVLFERKCYVTDHNHGIYSGDNGQSDPDIPPS